MAFALFGVATALVLIMLFGLDLAVGVPFQRVSLLMDVTYVFCGAVLAWLSWSCLRDLR
jgi:threonine/homoserine/homoserine lactone efflux protein